MNDVNGLSVNRSFLLDRRDICDCMVENEHAFRSKFYVVKKQSKQSFIGQFTFNNQNFNNKKKP